MRACLALIAISLASLAPASAQILPSLGGERSGTSGYQFLKIPVDARGAALGESVVASAADVTSLYWNPALAVQLNGLNAGFHHTSYFVDVALDFVGATYTFPGRGIAVGATLQTMNSGEMDITTEFQPEGTGEFFRLIDVGIGGTFAQRLTDLFSYGVSAKYIRESVMGLAADAVVFDLGVHYKVGATGAAMAVSVRNFGLDGRPEGSLSRTVIDQQPVQVESTFEALEPPTTFHLGFVYEALQANQDHSLLLSSQLNNPSDNAENWNVGAEYGWSDTLFLRAGYRFGIEESQIPSLGLGILAPVANLGVRFDYAFNRMERLGTVHRVGLSIGQ